MKSFHDQVQTCNTGTVTVLAEPDMESHCLFINLYKLCNICI